MEEHLMKVDMGKRICGEGQIAKQINDLMKLERLKYFKNKRIPS